jgi:cobalt-zinc-cadmium efflux system outer membrane protein
MTVRFRSLLPCARITDPRALAGGPMRLGFAIAVMSVAAFPALPATAATSPDPAALGVQPAAASPVETLLTEALVHNPEIAAARAESDAARQRVLPAGALENPMVEAGIINAPIPLSLRREDMTMKMLGLSQKFPYPGKRDLRRSVASADATSVEHAVDETVDRVARDVRVTYEGLRLALTSRRLVTDTLETVKQLVSIAEQRYSVGQATQTDALQAQAQVVRLQQELLRLGQEQQMRHSELERLLGRPEAAAPIVPTRATLLELPDAPDTLETSAQKQRPQLKSLAALIDKSDRELELARRDYYPDFEVRLSYGQRDRTPEGVPRDDMVSLTVAIELPLWRKSRLAPRVAEATAMHRQAVSLAESQWLETRAALENELASERQQRQSAQLFRSTLMPQTEAAFDSALTAYRVGRVDFMTLLEARMRVYETAVGEAEAIAGHNKAIAEIELLTGRAPDTAAREASQP